MPDISLSSGVDTSGVAAGMASIENTVKQAGNHIAGMLQGFFSAGVIVAEIEKITAAAETIHREAARFGVDAEQLQVVSNAAKQLGLDIGQVARAMNLLEINGQKALDPTTKQALAMEQLGISAKTFASLNADQKFLALADAYKNSAQDGQAYADVAELIGKRNTELIPLLAEGSKAIIEQGKAFRIMSNEEVDTLHALKVEEDKYVASLDGLLAQAVVSWGRYFANTRSMFQDFSSFLKGYAPTALGALIPGIGPFAPFFTGPFTGSGSAKQPQKPASPLGGGGGGVSGGGGAAPIGITDLAGGGLRAGAGSGSTAEWLSGLDVAEKINTLLKERETIVAKLNSEDEQGDVHAASRFQLEQQLKKVDQTLTPLRQQLTIEEQKDVDAADRRIEASQHNVELDQLQLQVRDALNRGDEYGAFLLQNQENILKINLDFDEKIQAAIDKANEARAKGLEQTAEENELLAQQLETEKQVNLALEQQRQAQERQRISQGPNPLTVNALAANNLRLGATGDVYVQALAASRGIQPGTPEYERLLQQVQAQDRLRQLQGSNLSFADQLNRDRLVQWFAQGQQQKANAAASKSHADEIAFWGAIAAGQPVPAGNPFANIFGSSPFTSANTIPDQGNTTAITQLSTQIDLLGQAVTSLQQIQKNTTLVNV